MMNVNKVLSAVLKVDRDDVDLIYSGTSCYSVPKFRRSEGKRPLAIVEGVRAVPDVK